MTIKSVTFANSASIFTAAYAGTSNVLGTVALTGPAPAGGIPVHLSLFPYTDTTNWNQSGVDVVIPAGSMGGDFIVSTLNPAKEENFQVTATSGNSTQTGTFVLDPITVVLVTFDPPAEVHLTNVPSNIPPGRVSTYCTGHVYLSDKAPEPEKLKIHVYANTSGYVQFSTAAEYTDTLDIIADGGSDNVSFTVRSINTGPGYDGLLVDAFAYGNDTVNVCPLYVGPPSGS